MFVSATLACLTTLVYSLPNPKTTSSSSASKSASATSSTKAAAPIVTVTTPAKFLNVTSPWVLEMPIGSTATSTAFWEVSDPTLQSFTDEYWYMNSAKTGVVFYTNNTGHTSGGSLHPRTELKNQAYWAANGTKTHQMNVTLQVDHVPTGRTVCVSQVFAHTEGPWAMFHVGPSNVFVRQGDTGSFPTTTLDGNYTSGTPFTLSLTAVNSNLIILYKNAVSGTAKSLTLSMPNYSDFLFAAGSYCQIYYSSDPSSFYCQVTMYSLTLKGF
ncbi:concanavalin A-like lectin/glucanase domain-containing protein [Chytriomyces sp. MP71]|nr:concanavalin A-like lectin/glucanase domain-containing protein [Chytriomyces sp. MP71]